MRIYQALLIIMLCTSIVYSMPANTNQGEIKIVGTISFLTDFANSLLGDEATYHSIIKASQDPHFVEPSAEDLTKLEESDVILAIGHEAIDGWILDFVNDNPNLSDKVIYPIDLDEVLVNDPLTDFVNPHFWLSPINVKILVQNIADELVERQLGASIVNTSLPVYMQKLDDLLASISNLSQQFIDTKVVEDHPAFLYLAELLGLERIGILEEQEGVDPSPLHIQQLSDKMKDDGVKLILASKIQAGSDVEELARLAGARIAYLYTLPGNDDAPSYLSMMEYNLNSIQNPTQPNDEEGLPLPFLPVFVGIIVLTIIHRRRIIRISPS